MAFNKAKALQEAEKSLAQGKASQAVKLYLDIYARDPADPTLLNTIGDLYIRERNVPEALRHFHMLAEAYTQEGFTLKAIAIYKKIFKLDPNNVEVLLKTGELYTVQGLGREAREHYMQAVEFLQKKNQNDRAVEAFRKIVALAPDNLNYRAKFAEFCEQIGRKGDAAGAFRESAEIALRKGDLAAAEAALVKATALDPQNPKTLVSRARLALTKNQPAEAEKILNSDPGLKSDPVAKRLLLEAYLGSKKADEAKTLVGELLRLSPRDFALVETFARLCLEKGEYDPAVAALAEASDTLVQQRATGPLMNILREIWTQQPHHLPTLELMYKVAEKTADEATLPDVLLALETPTQAPETWTGPNGPSRSWLPANPKTKITRGCSLGFFKKPGRRSRPWRGPSCRAWTWRLRRISKRKLSQKARPWLPRRVRKKRRWSKR